MVAMKYYETIYRNFIHPCVKVHHGLTALIIENMRIRDNARKIS
jgi:hypothetical protein